MDREHGANLAAIMGRELQRLPVDEAGAAFAKKGATACKLNAYVSLHEASVALCCVSRMRKRGGRVFSSTCHSASSPP